jgi:DNA-binding FadR family transcriptional regulator
MFHRRIYSAIRERDAAGARKAMQEHIADARGLMGQENSELHSHARRH